MLLFLARRKICSAILPIFAANLRRYASKSTQNPQSEPINSVMVDYLVASFGFSPDKAARVSKPIANLNSPDKPEAVCRFLREEGFSDDQLKTLITLEPRLLYAAYFPTKRRFQDFMKLILLLLLENEEEQFGRFSYYWRFKCRMLPFPSGLMISRAIIDVFS